MILIKNKNEKIVLRTAVDNDADTLLKWWNDGTVMAHAGFPNGLGTTKDKVLKNIAWSDDLRQLLIIELDNKPIGEMNYRTQNDAAEIGVKICEIAQQNHGLGTTALKMLIKHLFDQHYTKIMLDTNLNNLRAQHVYKKLGFVQVSIAINSWVDQLGVPQSIINYELTKLAYQAMGGYSD